MQYKVRDWMINLIVYIDPESPVSEALAIMRRRYIHSLIVQRSKDNPEYGILTSTDINDKIVAPNLNPSSMKVRDIMSSPILYVKTDHTLQECALIMKQNHFHHLPVIDDKGNIVGMISSSDFLVAAEAMGREPGERIT